MGNIWKFWKIFESLSSAVKLYLPLLPIGSKIVYFYLSEFSLGIIVYSIYIKILKTKF